MRRLLPEPATDVTVLEHVSAERTRHADGRPWLALCMVASIDGTIVVDGASGALSNDTDTELLQTLRSLADVIIVGAGTVRAEGYGPPSTPGQRVGVVTNSAKVDLDSALFTSGSGFVICPDDAPALPVDTVRAGGGTLDLRRALDQIPTLVPGAAFVQAEGGAVLNGALLDAGLIDEINLTTSPQLAGGTGPRLTRTDRDHRVPYRLGAVSIDDEGFVFSRWVRDRAC